MSLNHEETYNLDRRVWFILDELPALPPAFGISMADLRVLGSKDERGVKEVHHILRFCMAVNLLELAQVLNACTIHPPNFLDSAKAVGTRSPRRQRKHFLWSKYYSGWGQS